jgi:truncated hemoglobin YjbI
MFGKKPPSDAAKSQPAGQSQSISNVTLNGGMVQLGQAGGNLQQNQTGDLHTQQQGITGADVVALLERLETAVKGTSLSPSQQDELLDYLRPAKREASKEEPNKELVGQNLKQVSETMQTLKETTEAGSSLWQTGVDVFQTIAPWLGVATAFFGI